MNPGAYPGPGTGPGANFAGAMKGGSKSNGKPITPSWENLSKSGYEQWGKFTKNLSKSAADAKRFTMQVETKVDFIGPAVESAKSTSSTLWGKIPPSMQTSIRKGAPYGGVALAAGVGTRFVCNRHATIMRERAKEKPVSFVDAAFGVNQQQAKLRDELQRLQDARTNAVENLQRSEVKASTLMMEKEQLAHKLDDMRNNLHKPSAEMARMATYIAQASQAAAAAASAAAEASSSCRNLQEQVTEKSKHSNSVVGATKSVFNERSA